MAETLKACVRMTSVILTAFGGGRTSMAVSSMAVGQQQVAMVVGAWTSSSSTNSAAIVAGSGWNGSARAWHSSRRQQMQGMG